MSGMSPIAKEVTAWSQTFPEGPERDIAYRSYLAGRMAEPTKRQSKAMAKEARRMSMDQTFDGREWADLSKRERRELTGRAHCLLMVARKSLMHGKGE